MRGDTIVTELSKKAPSLEAVNRQLAINHLDWFVRLFWETIVPDELVWNWHMTVLCNELQELVGRVIQRKPKEYDLIFNVPPGTTKSIITSVMFPAWAWIKAAWLRFITGSYGADLSLDLAEKSRTVIRSDKYRVWFPRVVLSSANDAKSDFSNTAQGRRVSTSTGGGITGKHADVIIIDDPLNPKQAMAETRKELAAANNWLDRTLSTRKTIKSVTPTILIMQRLAEGDPTDHMIRKGKPVRHICLPGKLSDLVKPEELRSHYIDGLLDPLRLPQSELDNLYRDLGPVGYSGQVDQKPIPEGGIMFKVSQIEYVDNFNPGEVMYSIRYWDKAATQGGGKFTAGVLMNKMRDGKYLISDVTKVQWSVGEREKLIKSTAQLDGARVVVYVEQEPGSGGKESAQNTVRNLAGFRVYADPVSDSKEARAEPYAAQMEMGNIQVLRRSWTTDFVREHEPFPGGEFRDQVDAAAGAFNKLARIHGKLTW